MYQTCHEQAPAAHKSSAPFRHRASLKPVGCRAASGASLRAYKVAV
jgi:hypothetical protein